MLGACEDFLEREPLDQRVESNFFQSESDAQEALVAMYDALGWNTVVGFHPLPMFSDIASDDAYAGGASRNDAPNIIEIDQYNIRTTNSEVLGLWRKYYIGIYRANLYLEKIEGVEADEAFKQRTTAEAKFLRAYYYFDLLRVFEKVPLLTRTLSSPSEYSQPQNSPAEVYNQIARDLVEAMEDLPNAIPANESGRISKWAAKALLGRAFLYVDGVYGA
ncbi:MAG: RagB/SusD family nutrient uptake outer membrane protein, partial [Bacteroidia bacterium]|nr:RagB/SusD family nutrient uptake outer membrane protein [Bacteroidia bacterium]